MGLNTSKTKRPVALVTGGSRGIGRAIAMALARDAGHDVVVNYASNASAADEVTREIESLGNGAAAFPVKGDIGIADDRANLVRQTIDRFGRIDLLVNNAGVAPSVRADLLEAGEAFVRPVDRHQFERALFSDAARRASDDRFGKTGYIAK